MSNSLTGFKLWTLDTVAQLSPGICTDMPLSRPITVQRLVYCPTAQNQSVTLTVFTSSKVAGGNDVQGVVTLTNPTGSTCRIAGTGFFPVTVTVGSVLALKKGNTAANLGYYLVAVAGNANQVDLYGQFTTLETGIYAWDVYSSQTAVYLPGGASDASPVTFDYSALPKKFPNLSLSAISAGQLYVYIA